jgi:hypothetical protein
MLCLSDDPNPPILHIYADLVQLQYALSLLSRSHFFGRCPIAAPAGRGTDDDET